jgi:hypothetical protein
MTANPEGCAHQWKQVMHLDSCHTFTDAFACSICGSSAIASTEREPMDDPYALVFMRTEECQRCQELRDGAPVANHIVMQSPDGTVLKDLTIERPQENDENDLSDD